MPRLCMLEVTLEGRDSVRASRYDPRASLLTEEAGIDEDTLVGSAGDDVRRAAVARTPSREAAAATRFKRMVAPTC